MANSHDRALLVAVKHKLIVRCRSLLSSAGRGVADVNATDPDFEGGKSPILIAAQEGYTEIVNLLIRYRADVHKRCAIGMTPLHYAASNGDETMVLALIKEGADVNAIDKMQETPLHGAALFAHESVVKALLEAGADANSVSQLKRIPLDEVNLRNDKRVYRDRIRKMLRRKSPETFYSVLFGRDRGSSMEEWLKRMLRALKSPHSCKIFYTTQKAAVKLGLLDERAARHWIEKALIQCMNFCRTGEDRQILKTITEHAANDIGKDLADVLRDYCTVQEGDESHEDWSMRKAIAREIESFRPLNGLDGKSDSIRNCLDFCVGALKQFSVVVPIELDTANQNKAKMNALFGIMGVIINTILREGDVAFDRFVSETTDFLNFLHMESIVQNGDWLGHKRPNLDSLNDGHKSCDRVLNRGPDAIADSLTNGFVLFGLCSAILREESRGSEPVPVDTPRLDTAIRSPSSMRSQERTSYTHGPIVHSEVLSQGSSLPSHPSSLDSRGGRMVPAGPATSQGSNSRSTAPTTGTGPSVTPNNVPSSLHWAVAEGDIKKVEKELRKGSVHGNGSINLKDFKGRSALDLAALSGQKDIFSLIKEHGGQTAYFQNEDQMNAVMEYCSMDAEGNRLGIFRTYFGSTGGSSRGSRSGNSSLTSWRRSFGSRTDSGASRRGDESISTGGSSRREGSVRFQTDQSPLPLAMRRNNGSRY